MTEPNRDLPATRSPTLPSEAAVAAKRAEARRQFIKRGAIAGTGVVVYTIHHQRSFAGSKKLLVSSVEACVSIGGDPGHKKKVVDSINPVQKIDKNGNPKYDKDGNPEYEKTAIRYECEMPIKLNPFDPKSK